MLLLIIWKVGRSAKIFEKRKIYKNNKKGISMYKYSVTFIEDGIKKIISSNFKTQALKFYIDLLLCVRNISELKIIRNYANGTEKDITISVNKFLGD